MKTKRNPTLVVALVGGVLLILIFVFGTIWSGQRARGDTDAAVRSVSLLYLDELAGRREQVVEGNLDQRIYDMRVAIALMTNDDHSSRSNLSAYQKRMKDLYQLDKFAFVDEDGLIYTSLGTQTNIDEYPFDYKSLSDTEIAIFNLHSDQKKVIIAERIEPIELDGKMLCVCFMEISMDEMLRGVSMQESAEGSTVYNIYTSEGFPLSSVVLGADVEEDNLLTALESAEFEAGYSYSRLERDFADGKRGQASFTYGGERSTLSYTPIHGTDWLLTYLINESIISDKISYISDSAVQRSLLQSLLSAAVLITMFALIVSQMRRNSRLQLEKETADAESRVKQQDLEQQLQLQAQLLEQEKLRTQQHEMITALSSDYRSVYYVNLDTDDAVSYRKDPEDHDATPLGVHFSFNDRFSYYAEKYVAENYREGFLNFIQPQQIRDALARESIIVYRYLVNRDGREYYEMLRMAGVRQRDERADDIVRSVGVGFTVIDAEMRESLARNQALSDALATAEQANRAKTAFLSNMSHEIRTPMNAIIGLDSLALHSDGLTQETREYLEKIDGSARHLLGLINDILDMSRIESGRLTLRREDFSFRSMLEQIITMVSSQCREKGLTFDCATIGGVSDRYIGDDMKLKQVLINILSNAIKFTDAPGKVTLTVERIAVFEDQSTLRFIIKDTGIGVDKDFLPRMFEPFTQENSGRDNKYGSTGLGMAITKNIVDLMNGTISVESEKGVGTAFTVVITLKNSEQSDSGNSYVKPGDMRVLVVDDEEVAAEHARIVLDEVGIKADTCFSGESALQMIELAHTKHNPYNLVLLDWRMPEMDGLEVARRIRERYERETTVIILTSFNWDEIMDEALHAGVDSFLAKPLFASNVISEFERIARRNNMNLSREKHRVELAGRHILLAEDIIINAEIMKQIITMKDAEIDHAENGRIALDMFRASPVGHYDAILMDVRMPEMDGLAAAAAIRALDRPDAARVPIIALTANAFDEDVQRSLQAGMNAHLSKPVEPDHLYQTLEELIWEAENRG